MAEIGKRSSLVVVRMSAPGLYLDGGGLGEILLPRRYLLPHFRPGSLVDVFVYRDSEDRLVATTESPLAMVGEFACLTVLSVNRQIGAFLDWGLSKDLLLPFREQEVPVRAGQRVVVYVGLDQSTDRIVATSRLKRHLNRTPPPYQSGQEVDLTIVEKTPLGYNAIVEAAHLGLLFQSNPSPPLEIGQRVKGFVRAIHPGGKIDLSLDASGYERIAPLKDQILQALEENGGRLPFNDDSAPAAIRTRFGVSKKAFKAALGALYKARRIEFRPPGIQLLNTPSPPWGRGQG
jgi:predicted RNA-binding protein (virulence factor B family)